MLKAFYELKLMKKPLINPELDKRCEALLDTTQEWFQSRPTQASLLAKYAVLLFSFVMSILCSPAIISIERWMQPLGAVPAGSETSRILENILRVISELGCFSRSDLCAINLRSS